MKNYRRFVFVRDVNLFDLSKIKFYHYKARSLADAFYQFEREITSSYDGNVTFLHHFISDNTFNYIVVPEIISNTEPPFTVEVYEE